MAAAPPDSFRTQGGYPGTPMTNPVAVSAHIRSSGLMARRTEPRGVIFSRPLPKTAIDKEMNVKGELLQRWSGVQGASSFRLRIKYNDKFYPMTCRSRSPGGKYKKWVLSNGWLKLVRENRLQEGHEVTLFEPDKDGGGFLMVDGLVSSTLTDSGLVSAAETLLTLNSASWHPKEL